MPSHIIRVSHWDVQLPPVKSFDDPPGSVSQAVLNEPLNLLARLRNSFLNVALNSNRFGGLPVTLNSAWLWNQTKSMNHQHENMLAHILELLLSEQPLRVDYNPLTRLSTWPLNGRDGTSYKVEIQHDKQLILSYLSVSREIPQRDFLDEKPVLAHMFSLGSPDFSTHLEILPTQNTPISVSASVSESSSSSPVPQHGHHSRAFNAEGRSTQIWQRKQAGLQRLGQIINNPRLKVLIDQVADLIPNNTNAKYRVKLLNQTDDISNGAFKSTLWNRLVACDSDQAVERRLYHMISVLQNLGPSERFTAIGKMWKRSSERVQNSLGQTIRVARFTSPAYEEPQIDSATEVEEQERLEPVSPTVSIQ